MSKGEKDEREDAVKKILEENGGYVHVAMWYLTAIKDHGMVKLTQSGEVDKRNNIGRLANRLSNAVYGMDFEP